jgi:hypothetical protein
MRKSTLFFGVMALALVACAGAEESSITAPDDGSDELNKVGAGAGLYTNYGGKWDDGLIFEARFNADHTFKLNVRGEYGCDVYQGYSCPASWSDGRTGWTDIEGTWKSKGGNVLTLQPKGPQKRASDPFDVTLVKSGAKTKISGAIPPNRPIAGEMDVVALFGAPHTAKLSDLDGHWEVTNKPDKDGDQQRIDGTGIYVKGMQHFIDIDAKEKTLLEWRSDSKPRSNTRRLAAEIAGAPDGKGPGVLVFGDTEAARIKSVKADAIELVVDDEGHTLTLERR